MKKMGSIDLFRHSTINNTLTEEILNESKELSDSGEEEAKNVNLGLQKQNFNIFQTYIQSKTFYSNIKMNPNSFLNNQEKHHHQFHHFCEKNGSMSMPAFANLVRGNSIQIINYRMDPNLVAAFCQYLQIEMFSESVENTVEKLVIENCGMTDSSIACILETIRNNSPIEAISITKDEFGEKSFKILNDMIDQAKCPLRKLQLNQCKVHDPSLLKTFELLDKHCCLSLISISNINLGSNRTMFAAILEFLDSCPNQLTHIKF